MKEVRSYQFLRYNIHQHASQDARFPDSGGEAFTFRNAPITERVAGPRHIIQHRYQYPPTAAPQPPHEVQPTEFNAPRSSWHEENHAGVDPEQDMYYEEELEYTTAPSQPGPQPATLYVPPAGGRAMYVFQPSQSVVRTRVSSREPATRSSQGTYSDNPPYRPRYDDAFVSSTQQNVSFQAPRATQPYSVQQPRIRKPTGREQAVVETLPMPPVWQPAPPLPRPSPAPVQFQFVQIDPTAPKKPRVQRKPAVAPTLTPQGITVPATKTSASVPSASHVVPRTREELRANSSSVAPVSVVGLTTSSQQGPCNATQDLSTATKARDNKRLSQAAPPYLRPSAPPAFVVAPSNISSRAAEKAPALRTTRRRSRIPDNILDTIANLQDEQAKGALMDYLFPDSDESMPEDVRHCPVCAVAQPTHLARPIGDENGSGS